MVVVKEPKRAQVEILAGGLDDSDIEGQNPFLPAASDVTCKVITEKELMDGSNRAKRNTSHHNEVCTLFLWLSYLNLLLIPERSLFLSF